MSEYNHLIMRTVLGAILAFQGAKLLGVLLQDKPENYILMAIIAIAFIALGTIFAVNSIKSFIALKKEEETNIISYEELKKSESDVEEKTIKEQAKGEDESCE